MAENVYLFVPNLIGFVRILLAVLSFYLMPTYPLSTMFCYLFSELLDAFDGHFARLLNQSTKFGAVLDMLTDRCSTAGLLVTLGAFYPKYQFLFIMLLVLDIASHWAQMYSSLVKGSTSHKNVDASANFFLRLYYTSRPVLFCMCAGNELFLATLYALHFNYSALAGPTVSRCISYVAVACFPVFLAKQMISVVQLCQAFSAIANHDVQERQKK